MEYKNDTITIQSKHGKFSVVNGELKPKTNKYCYDLHTAAYRDFNGNAMNTELYSGIVFGSAPFGYVPIISCYLLPKITTLDKYEENSIKAVIGKKPTRYYLEHLSYQQYCGFTAYR